jgi:hypothetical protein
MDRNGVALREFFYSNKPASYIATTKSVGKRLQNHLDEPVKHGNRTLILCRHQDTGANLCQYNIKST